MRDDEMMGRDDGESWWGAMGRADDDEMMR